MITTHSDSFTEEQRISHYKSHELRRGFQEAIERFSGVDHSLNGSYPVTLDPKIQSEFNVYPYARMEFDFDHYTVTAAPKESLHYSAYKMPTFNYLSAMEELREGKPASFDLSYKIPKPEPVKHEETSVTCCYEKELFAKIYAFQHKLYLLNPSRSSLWAAEAYPFYIICDPEWREGYRSQLDKLGRNFDLSFATYDPGVITYYGSNGRPEGYDGLWCAFWPNPTNLAMYTAFSVTYQDTGLDFSYKKKDRVVNRFMEYATLHSLFNSCSVDGWLGLNSGVYLYETNTSIRPNIIVVENTSPIGYVSTEDWEKVDLEVDISYGVCASRVAQYSRLHSRVVMHPRRGDVAITLGSFKPDTTFFHSDGNMSTKPVSSLVPLPADPPAGSVKMIIVHTDPVVGERLLSIPGTRFSPCLWHPGTKKLYIPPLSGRWFAATCIDSVARHQLSVIRHFFNPRFGVRNFFSPKDPLLISAPLVRQSSKIHEYVQGFSPGTGPTVAEVSRDLQFSKDFILATLHTWDGHLVGSIDMNIFSRVLMTRDSVFTAAPHLRDLFAKISSDLHGFPVTGAQENEMRVWGFNISVSGNKSSLVARWKPPPDLIPALQYY